MKSDFQVPMGNGSHGGIGSGLCPREPATEDGVGRQPPAGPPCFPAVFPGGNALPGCSQPREACARRDLELAISAWHETLLKAILFLGSPLAETFSRMACSLRLLSPNPLPSSLLPLEALGLLFPPFFIHSLRHIRFHHGSYSRTLKLALRFIRKPIYSYSLLLGS